jgi:hydrogenase-4 component B
MPHRVAGTLSVAVASIAPGAATDIASTTLAPVALLAPLIALAVVLFGVIRRWTVARVPQEHAATWGCGYVATTPVMQYTASSFAEPLTGVLKPLLRTSVVREDAFLSSTTPDRVLVRLYLPVFLAVSRVAARVRSYHRARVSRSLLYIVVTVIVLLALLFLPTVRP